MPLLSLHPEFERAVMEKGWLRRCLKRAARPYFHTPTATTELLKTHFRNGNTNACYRTFETNHIPCVMIPWMASEDCSNWPITWSMGTLMHGHFQQSGSIGKNEDDTNGQPQYYTTAQYGGCATKTREAQAHLRITAQKIYRLSTDCL